MCEAQHGRSAIPVAKALWVGRFAPGNVLCLLRLHSMIDRFAPPRKPFANQTFSTAFQDRRAAARPLASTKNPRFRRPPQARKSGFSTVNPFAARGHLLRRPRLSTNCQVSAASFASSLERRSTTSGVHSSQASATARGISNALPAKTRFFAA